jgi:hypothetical protein
MTEAMLGRSIVTPTIAAGYPECEDPTAHPLARSKWCDGRAEYVGQSSDCESSRNEWLGDVQILNRMSLLKHLQMDRFAEDTSVTHSH